MKTSQQNRQHPHKRSRPADPAGSLQLLREANAQLERFLASFSGSETQGDTGELQSLLTLHDLLERITPLLYTQKLQACRDVRTQRELAVYAHNLVRLRSELAAAQASAAISEVAPFPSPKRECIFLPTQTTSSYDC
jgi:hypothetical protein